MNRRLRQKQDQQRKPAAQRRAEDRILSIASGAGRSASSQAQGLSNVYQEILSEVSEQSAPDGGPAHKRRRVGGGTRAHPIHINSRPTSGDEQASAPRLNRSAQVVIDTDDSAEDDDDFEWEDAAAVASSPGKPRHNTDVEGITVDVSGHVQTPRKAKRKAATSAQKRLVVNVHKCHVLFLLFHGHVRNMWCNDRSIESTLRTFLTASIIKSLNPSSALVQLRQSDLFREGLRNAVDLWKAKFKVIKPGLRRTLWADGPEELEERRQKIAEELEDMSKAGLVHAARSLQGSQDTGNQLFCALLRAVGVEARLVFSLQPLPLTPTLQRLSTPTKEQPVKPRIYATFESEQDSTSSADEQKSANSDNDIFKNPRRRLGQVGAAMPIGNYYSAAPTPPRKKIRTLNFPVFWIEALNPAYQRWVPVDPLVTDTIGRPAKLEPPASYDGNAMSYVIAYEENGVAKDVTRRYARAFNAKTRKTRIESTADGKRWLESALKVFRRPHVNDRDQIEEAELSRKEAQEGLPNSIQDFKDHPQYALERHLKRNEIIWPKKEIGKVNAGKSGSKNQESIYRRSSVQTVQSADKWYRLGREIKTREQPMKHVPARNHRRHMSADSEEDEAELTALYAYSQTAPYIPPPVVRGKVPRNVYGNIDIYVPSMVPMGGVHIRHPLAKKAAQALAIDFSEAVTGFQFKGRQGTAVIQGAVVAEENAEAVNAVIQGYSDDAERDKDEARSLECLRLWRRFILGLQIAQRIGLSDIHAADDEHMQKFREELDDAADQDDGTTVESGGFFPDSGADTIMQPTSHLFEESRPEEDVRPSTRRHGKLRQLALDEHEEDAIMRYEPREQSDFEQSLEQDNSQSDGLAFQDADEIRANPQSVADDHIAVQHEIPRDDLGGGFVVEGSVERTSTLRSGIAGGTSESAIQDPATQAVGSGGGVEAEANTPNAASTTSDGDAAVGFLPEVDSADVTGADVTDSHAISQAMDTSHEEHEEAFGEGVDDDQVSLLSHDPDDEDADPEWL